MKKKLLAILVAAALLGGLLGVFAGAQNDPPVVVFDASKGERICELSIAPVTFETLLKRIFEDYSLTMTFEQHALVGSTVRSYLTYLKDSDKMTSYIENNLIYFKSN